MPDAFKYSYRIFGLTVACPPIERIGLVRGKSTDHGNSSQIFLDWKSFAFILKKYERLDRGLFGRRHEFRFLKCYLFEILIDERPIEEAEPKLHAKYISHRVVDRFHRHPAALYKLFAELIVCSADHLHIGAAVERVHRRFAVISGKSVRHEFFHGCVVAHNQAVEFPFIAKDLSEQPRIRG